MTTLHQQIAELKAAVVDAIALVRDLPLSDAQRTDQNRRLLSLAAGLEAEYADLSANQSAAKSRVIANEVKNIQHTSVISGRFES